MKWLFLSLLLYSNNIDMIGVRNKLARLKVLCMVLNRKFQINPELYLECVTSQVTRQYCQLPLFEIFARSNIFELLYFPRLLVAGMLFRKNYFRDWILRVQLRITMGLEWLYIFLCIVFLCFSQPYFYKVFFLVLVTLGVMLVMLLQIFRFAIFTQCSKHLFLLLDGKQWMQPSLRTMYSLLHCLEYEPAVPNK